MNSRFTLTVEKRIKRTIGTKTLELVVLGGNTYPIREELRALGGSFSEGMWTIDAAALPYIRNEHRKTVANGPVSEGQYEAIQALVKAGIAEEPDFATLTFGKASDIITDGRRIERYLKTQNDAGDESVDEDENIADPS